MNEKIEPKSKDEALILARKIYQKEEKIKNSAPYGLENSPDGEEEWLDLLEEREAMMTKFNLTSLEVTGINEEEWSTILSSFRQIIASADYAQMEKHIEPMRDLVKDNERWQKRLWKHVLPYIRPSRMMSSDQHIVPNVLKLIEDVLGGKSSELLKKYFARNIVNGWARIRGERLSIDELLTLLNETNPLLRNTIEPQIKEFYEQKVKDLDEEH